MQPNSKFENAIRYVGFAYFGLVFLFLTYLGVIWAFAPASQMIKLDITSSSLAGTNTLKSIMGAGLLSMAIFSLMFIIRSKTWFSPLATLTSLLLVVRITTLSSMACMSVW
ncbi:hypothetical protein [Ruegeria jejuensis]|uniref:hypothetical protein n=1 Tax=Ruegeria jejuensis TaxID=3233338 RepID=UPI00355C7BEE